MFIIGQPTGCEVWATTNLSPRDLREAILFLVGRHTYTYSIEIGVLEDGRRTTAKYWDRLLSYNLYYKPREERVLEFYKQGFYFDVQIIRESFC